MSSLYWYMWRWLYIPGLSKKVKPPPQSFPPLDKIPYIVNQAWTGIWMIFLNGRKTFNRCSYLDISAINSNYFISTLQSSITSCRCIIKHLINQCKGSVRLILVNLSDQELDISYNFVHWLFSIVVSLHKWIADQLRKT